MPVFFKSFWLPKAGNADAEYEDAFCPDGEGETNQPLVRFAVADGATESLLSRQWAELLVKIYTRYKGDDLDWNKFLPRCHEQWEKLKRDYLHKREKQKRPVQWYEEEGLNAGAFCSFVGITLKSSQEGLLRKWTCVAVGDACLFQVRANKLIASFPLVASAAFNNRPFLIPSNPARAARVGEAVKNIEGDCSEDDQLYLMTDALACWFLRQHENGGCPWQTLRDLDTKDMGRSFPDWISILRTTGDLRNDDVTLLRIDVA